MDVKLSIGEEEVGMNTSIKEEVHDDEGGASLNNASVTERTVKQQDAVVFAAARKLADVIEEANIEDIYSTIQTLTCQTLSSAIFNFRGLPWGSLLHIAAATGKSDILLLLLEHVDANLIAAKDDWLNTPLHIATKAKAFEVADMLIRHARNLSSGEDNKWILRRRNEHGNTPLHEAVLTRDARLVSHLLSIDLEPVYWENVDRKSPLYLALDTGNSDIFQILLSHPLDPSRIKGLPPVHGAVARGQYGLAFKILNQDDKLFAMTDSIGRNVFHLAAYENRPQVFELLGPETAYLAREWDKNGDRPIHIASKMGYVDIVEKLSSISLGLNKRGQTILHIAAKYGRTSVVRYMLKHPRQGRMVCERDYAGNTALHLAAMHSQPATLIPLVLDERIDPFLLNHQLSTALDIALNCVRREYTLRKQLTAMVLASACGKRPTGNEAFPIIDADNKKPSMDHLKNLIGNRSVVATLVATVTFAAGFAVPGGFNSSDTASKDDRGMATMLDKRMFQAFAICNTIAMFCSMTAVVTLLWAQQNDVRTAMVAYRRSMLPLKIALPAMSVAFLTGVTLTIGKLPWLANTIFYLGLVFLLIISVAKLLEDPPLIWSRRRPIRIMVSWLVLTYIYLWEVETDVLDDSEEDRMVVEPLLRGLLDDVSEKND